MEKNQVFTVEISDISQEGLGIGKQEGFVWFIKDALVGDVVEAAVMKSKKHYGFARLQRVLSPSPHRRKASCSIARACGGCQLQEMAYEAQLHFKERKVREDLLRIGELPKDLVDRVMEPILGMPLPLRYRNKAQYPVGLAKGRPIAGFYAGRSHQVIEGPDCLLGPKENPVILDTILHWINKYHVSVYDEKTGLGLVRHILLRKAFSTGEYMVCLVVNGNTIPKVRELTAALLKLEKKAGFSCHLGSLCINQNTSRGNVIMGRETRTLYGPGYITDTIGDIRFRISPLSFYQVNPWQTERMYGKALEFANLQGKETVWDLYCGIGTISLFLAGKAKQVYGVEIIPQAIENAMENAAINHIENARFFTGAAEEILPRWYKEHPGERIDVICVDPPRKGCDETCLETMAAMAPKRIVYVSCDPATLARDIRYLRGRGYEVEQVQPVDNFPQTVHVETVCLLSNRKPDTKVRIDVDLEDYYRIKDSKKNQD